VRTHHVATFFAKAEDAAGAELPQFVKDEFDAFLDCGILAQLLLAAQRRLRDHGVLAASFTTSAKLRALVVPQAA